MNGGGEVGGGGCTCSHSVRRVGGGGHFQMFISIFFLVLMFNEVQSHIDICLYGVVCLYCIYSFNHLDTCADAAKKRQCRKLSIQWMVSSVQFMEGERKRI